MKKILTLVTSLVALTQLVFSQTREDFTLGGLSAFIIAPANPAPGKPWIAYGPSVGDLPHWTGTGEEKWMFDRYFAAGIAVVGIYSGDLSGNVAQRAGYTLLYNELVNNRGYASRFCFHARSRGGLISYNWAADNPGKVAAIGGIYPVTNLLSYPGEVVAADNYGVTVAQLNADIALYNPIARLGPLFNSGVKIFHIHGDNDGLVPLSANSQITKTNYDALGGSMTLKVIPGGGHDVSDYWFQDQDLTDFMIARSLETVAITSAPTLNTQTLVTPADGAVNVAPSSNLTASFSEPIALTGTGSILLKNLSGGADVTINLPSDVSISGNVLTINPLMDLISGQQYAVEISSDAIKDLDVTPNNYAGLLATSSPNWNFTTQAQPPLATVANPSFELDAVADGGYIGAGATSWTKTGSGIAGPQDFLAAENPQATDGEQHAFANGGNSLSQVTPSVVQAGQTYTLTVDVGQISNFTSSQATIHLFGSALGINTPLANTNGTAQLASIAPASGTYLTNRTVTYTALASGDPFQGQQIGIALVGESGIQVLFDNVRLTQVQTPPPAVANPSFELDVVADGSFTGAGAIGWTKTGSDIAGPQDFNAAYNPQATDGEQHAFTNGGTSLSQVTPFRVEAGRTYALSVDVGRLSVIPSGLATIRLFGSTLGIDTPLANANGTAQLASIAPAGGSYLTNQTVTYTALASGDPFLGQRIGIALVGESGVQVLFDNVRLTPLTNDYAAWIAGFASVGTQIGFNQDADGDSIPNGVESFFGSNPSVTSLGLSQVSRSGNTVTFQHPEATQSLSDVVGTYQWSLDLISWHASGVTSAGVTVAIPEPPAPVVGMTTVTANITAGSSTKLFLRLVVTKL
jgi:Bacterial Ig-like domain